MVVEFLDAQEPGRIQWGQVLHSGGGLPSCEVLVDERFRKDTTTVTRTSEAVRQNHGYPRRLER